jgi:diguanylate cyclase (GGDEF)-like protein/PAS domain S-box-containing protein
MSRWPEVEAPSHAADALGGNKLREAVVAAGRAGVLFSIMLGSVSGLRRRRGRNQAEDSLLRESEERLRALVHHGSDMITVVAPDTTVLYQAGPVDAMIGWQPAELEGTKLTTWIDPGDAAALVALCASQDPRGQELRMRCRDGSLRVCEARATSLLDHPSWGGIVLAIRDVSERKALEEQLRHQAFHDALTGLANRALFADRLEHALARGERMKAKVAVMLIDLDDFKSINDSLGHAAGDDMLRDVAERLRSSIRTSDTLARVGGDEFAVIVENVDTPADYAKAASRVLDAFVEPVEVAGRHLPVTATVGIACATLGSCDGDQLVCNADLAMYSAKLRGGSGWAAFRPEMHDAIQEGLQLKADLLRAVSGGGQLMLDYQPIVSLDDSAIVGVEALARWNHPTRGRLLPHDFIPLAEESGTIVSIGRWVLHEACRQAQRWVDLFVDDLTIAVNVSARQLDADGLIDDVRAALSESGLAPQRLVLEITESELMTNFERAGDTLTALQQLGVRIAIDDFGTGYSSLGQLQHLPVDILKVDRVFADPAGKQSDNGGLLGAVMAIGESLHLTTIAEGIETATQLEELKALACPLGQGYLFSHPVPANAIDALLARQS